MKEVPQQEDHEQQGGVGVPLSDAWWTHLSQVFHGKPPHPREYYVMPSDGTFRATDPYRFDQPGDNYAHSE